MATDQRDVVIDGIRGLLLACMTCVHLPFILGNAIYERFGFISEAEGFVFISGLGTGIAYLRALKRRELSYIWRRAAYRAMAFFISHVIIFLSILLLLNHTLSGDQIEYFFGGTWRRVADLRFIDAALSIVGLRSQPRYMDILPLFFLFALVSPFLGLVLQRSSGSGILCGSILLWLMVLLRFPGVSDNAHASRHVASFYLLSWQVLMVIGLWVGYFSERILKLLREPRNRHMNYYALFVVMCLMFLRSTPQFSNSVGDLADKPTLGPLRLLNLISVSVVMVWAYPMLLKSKLVAVFAILGRFSLQVFCYHLVVISIVAICLSKFGEPNLRIGLCIELLVVASLWSIPASYRMIQIWISRGLVSCKN